MDRFDWLKLNEIRKNKELLIKMSRFAIL